MLERSDRWPLVSGTSCFVESRQLGKLLFLSYPAKIVRLISKAFPKDYDVAGATKGESLRSNTDRKVVSTSKLRRRSNVVRPSSSSQRYPSFSFVMIFLPYGISLLVGKYDAAS